MSQRLALNIDPRSANCKQADSRVEAIRGSASAGFRLSLVLNAVRLKLNDAGSEITRISKAVSEFSLMLKQVGIALDTAEPNARIATPLAVETVFDIKEHSDVVFDEIKSITDLAQVRDEQGHLTEIGVGEQIRWSFEQHAKLPYLIGQLDYLKLNLAIMLQILQLGHAPQPLGPRLMMQERAEVQNMIVLQHWSFESLKTLYNLAREERPKELPAGLEPGARLTINAAPTVVARRANSQEHPVQELDEAMHQALTRENAVLGAPVSDLVSHLLHQWTAPVEHRKPPSYQARISDEGDTTESYSASSEDDIRGRFLEGLPRKSVKFRGKQARVEDGLDESESVRGKPTRRHILSDATSSDSSNSDDSPRPSDRQRRPYISVAPPKPGIRPSAPAMARPIANASLGTSPKPPFLGSQGNSPNLPQHATFRPPSLVHAQSQPQVSHSRPPARTARGHTTGRFEERPSRGHNEPRERKSANRNLKKGIGLGAAAAGLMEILGALEGF